jgi:hypothetical protein
MSMTKKDYVAIAAIFAEYQSYGESPEVEDVVDQLGKYFKTDNPRFDIDRFRKAAGFE